MINNNNNNEGGESGGKGKNRDFLLLFSQYWIHKKKNTGYTTKEKT